MSKPTKEVKDRYAAKFTQIGIRVLSPEENNGIDYKALMEKRALELGFKNKLGNGNISAYLLSLAEADLQQAGYIETLSKNITERDNLAK